MPIRLLWVLIGLCIGFISLTSCTSKSLDVDTVREFSGAAFGSHYKIKYRRDKDLKELESKKLQAEVEDLIRRYDAEFSLWKKDSFLVRFNELKDGSSVPVSTWAMELYQGALPIYQTSLGAFDPTVGPLVQLWGFSKDKAPKIPKTAEIESTLKSVGLSKLVVKDGTWQKKVPNLTLDFNAFAPGHVADLLGQLLNAYQIQDYLIDVGGELLAKGYRKDAEAWLVGIEVPSETYAQAIIKTVPLSNQAIATSGSYRNYLATPKGRISHTIDPRTGLQPQNKIISATVIASTALEADAWATALMVLGPSGLELPPFVKRDGFATYLLEDQGDGKLKEHWNVSMQSLLKRNP